MRKPPEQRLAYAPQMHGKTAPKPVARATTPEAKLYGAQFQKRGK